MIGEDTVNGAVVFGGVPGPVHMDSVRAGIGLELIEILVEMGERVLLDGRGELTQHLPFRNAVHLAVAFLAQVP